MPFSRPGAIKAATGLGLHIVHNIVTNRLGGHLNLESEPGKGTTVQMILLRVAPAESASDH